MTGDELPLAQLVGRASDNRMTVRGFKVGPQEHQQEQGYALTHPRLTGLKTGRGLDTFSWDVDPHKRSAHTERRRCHESWRTERYHTRAVTARTPSQDFDEHDEHRIETVPTQDRRQQKFFSLNPRSRKRKGGAAAPPTTAGGGRSLPIRQPRAQPLAGRQACGLPPASQHDAVCGGGGNPTVTASCCEGGLGGDRHA